jgi:succinate-acetate transporter protein
MAREARAADVVPAAPAIADPGPLGLAGFALTTVLLSGINAGLIKHVTIAGPPKVITPIDAWVGMALFYGGLGQFCAGMWEFKNRNTFGATAFSSFGAFWMGLAIMVVFGAFNTNAAFYGGEGAIWFLFLWAVFTTYMWVASLRTNGAVMVVFLLLALTFWALWIGALNGSAAGKGMTQVGGYLGLVTAIVAFYTSFAGVINSTFGRVIAPVFPLNT